MALNDDLRELANELDRRAGPVSIDEVIGGTNSNRGEQVGKESPADHREGRKARLVLIGATALIAVLAAGLVAVLARSQTDGGTQTEPAADNPPIPDESMTEEQLADKIEDEAQDQTSTTSATQADTPTPSVGDEIEAALNFDSVDCQDNGSVEAFGISWTLLDAVPRSWRYTEPRPGQLIVTTDELATFVDAEDGTALTLTSGGRDEECVTWDE